MTQQHTPIPRSVLNLLKQHWKDDGGFSTFEWIFKGDVYTKRRLKPSYYFIRPGDKLEWDIEVFSYKEATGLLRDKVFGRLAILLENGCISVNEHAQHALTDFCGEVSSAWAKYQNRIAEVERLGVFPTPEG